MLCVEPTQTGDLAREGRGREEPESRLPPRSQLAGRRRRRAAVATAVAAGRRRCSRRFRGHHVGADHCDVVHLRGGGGQLRVWCRVGWHRHSLPRTARPACDRLLRPSPTRKETQRSRKKHRLTDLAAEVTIAQLLRAVGKRRQVRGVGRPHARKLRQRGGRRACALAALLLVLVLGWGGLDGSVGRSVGGGAWPAQVTRACRRG